MEHKNMYSMVYNSTFSWETCNNITLDTFKIKSHVFFFTFYQLYASTVFQLVIKDIQIM